MKRIILIIVGSLVFSTVYIYASDKYMDNISKHIYTECKGNGSKKIKVFMLGMASGIRFTQMTYSKGKDKFYIEDHIAVDMACIKALKDQSDNRFSAKFKSALTIMFGKD